MVEQHGEQSMRIIDISMKIKEDMAVYKDKPEIKPKIKVYQTFENGKSYESGVEIGMHTGTHVDAPLHMIKGGKTIEQMDLSKLMMKCKVIDLTYIKDKITKNDLETKDIEKGDFILFKTINSFTDKFDFDFVFLEKSGAEYLRDKKIIGVGTDSLGIERSQPDHETHIVLLDSDIIILEGLRLKHVSEGEYFLAALPLNIDGVEASPVRAILMDKNPLE